MSASDDSPWPPSLLRSVHEILLGLVGSLGIKTWALGGDKNFVQGKRKKSTAGGIGEGSMYI